MNAQATELPPRLPFLDPRAKARATEAVRAFEQHTSAELVITVKKAARTYPEVDLAFGAVFAFVALLFLLFYPVEFSVTLMPVDALFAFVVGWLAAKNLPPLKRLALPGVKRRAAVEEAAKSAFVDLGVTNTSGRTGVLVHASLFERIVVIVTNRGVSAEATKAANDAQPVLEAALVASDVRAFAEALEALGPAFATTMPRAHDDVNELADEVA